MAQFKALAIIFHSIDVTINGKRYTDTIDPNWLAKAKTGLQSLSTRVTGFNPNVTLSITPYDSYNPKVLRALDLIDYTDKNGKLWKSPYIKPENLERIMRLTDPSFTINWGQYDTYFVIVPFVTTPAKTGVQDAGLAINGWGSYSPESLKGGAMAFLPAHWELDKFKGDGYLHEWLHGVCQFYKMIGWTNTISGGDSDDAGTFGYKEDTVTEGWGNYYKDLMTAKVAANRASGPTPLAATPGITNALWAGSMCTEPGSVIKDAGFKNAYVTYGGRTKVGYPKSDVHVWGAVDIMDFVGPSGSTAILRLKGTSAAYFLPNKWWLKYISFGGESIGAPSSDVHTWSGGKIVDLKKANGTTSAMMSTDDGNTIWHLPAEVWTKYKAVGGAPSIGYPKSDWHGWGKGKIMDFIGSAGYACGIMKSDVSSKLYLVKGLIWKAYVATAGNGATSYLGYPTSDEYTWKDGLFGWFGTEYYRQDFQGGWCWASKTNAAKFGNDKNFSTNK